MIEFFDVLNQNAIEASNKDAEILTHGAPDDDASWTDVLTYTHFVPAGNYNFSVDWVLEGVTNSDYYWRIIGDVDFPVVERKTERHEGRIMFSYNFPYSYPTDDDFTITIQFKAKNADDLPAWVRFVDFMLTRRS